MRLLPLTFLFGAIAGHAQLPATIVPPIPSASIGFEVRVHVGDCAVRWHKYEVSGNNLLLTVDNNGPSFLPNPPCNFVERISPLAEGEYNLVIAYVRPDGTPYFWTEPQTVFVAPLSAIADAIEFYHSALGHYFVTASAAEIAALDLGNFSGWQRTGEVFPGVILSDLSTSEVAAPAVPVCRFYGLPSAGLNSHFYSASAAECAAVAERWPDKWLLEATAAFYVFLPDAATGECPLGTKPVYRMYNNRPDANHRYTRSLEVRTLMVSQGWSPEGAGPLGVAMCT